MLAYNDVDRIARSATLSAFRKIKPSRVYSESAVDSEGQAALHVTIVLPSGSPPKIDGDMILNAIAGIQRDLIDAGEERFAIVDFATEEELAEDDASQS